jgi:hypothetical protein
LIATFRAWPRRRWLVAAATAPLAFVAYLLVSRVGQPDGSHAWWAWPAVVASAAATTVLVASYVPPPGSGRRIEVGCSPCAVVAGLSVAFAFFAWASAPADGVVALLALTMLAAGIRQRLTDAATCAVPLGGRAGNTRP